MQGCPPDPQQIEAAHITRAMGHPAMEPVCSEQSKALGSCGLVPSVWALSPEALSQSSALAVRALLRVMVLFIPSPVAAAIPHRGGEIQDQSHVLEEPNLYL